MKLQKRTLNRLSRQQGATLLETMMVIGIIALIAIGAVVAYNKVTEGRRITEATTNLGTMVGGIRNLFGAQGNYQGLANNVVIKAGFLSDEMHNGNSQIHHPWRDNAVTVAAGASPYREFTVTYSNIPEEACVNLVSTTIKNATSVRVNSTAITTGVSQIVTSCNNSSEIIWTFN